MITFSGDGDEYLGKIVKGREKGGHMRERKIH